MSHDDFNVYSGPERRADPNNMLITVEAVFERMIAKHEAREDANWDARMTRAFPGGDFDAHRAYHQDLIDAAQEQKKFWLAAQTKLLEKGIDGLFAVLKIVLVLALAGLAVKVGIAVPFLGDK